MSKQPEALRLADWCDANSSGIYRPSAEAAAELRRQHALIEELVGALKNMHLNVLEAMQTGGWVPTPLHSSFWDAVHESAAAIAKAEQQ